MPAAQQAHFFLLICECEQLQFLLFHIALRNVSVTLGFSRPAHFCLKFYLRILDSAKESFLLAAGIGGDGCAQLSDKGVTVALNFFRGGFLRS
jgi:hypothetical protein